MFQSLGSPSGAGSSGLSVKSGVNCKPWDLRKGSFGNKGSILTNLFRREVYGSSLHKLANPFGEHGTPTRLRMPIEEVIPPSALEAGNIFMGFTNCGRYILSYTCRPSENFGSVFDSDGTYMYTLHIWLFSPYNKVRKVSQVCLFDNNGVYDNNLLIDICQWEMDDSHLLITGHSANPDTECHHTFYTTITTIPDARNCPNCVYIQDDELDDESRTRTNCILHGLTLHMKYDHVPPFPKMNADVQLRFKDAVLLNTGNVIHVVSFRLLRPCPPKMETAVVPAAASAIMSTTRFPLRCDIWLKIPNANLLALASVKVNAQGYEGGKAVEDNIISLNALDSLSRFFPASTSTKPQIQNQNLPDALSRSHRRLSQSSTDSEFSLFSPKSFTGCDFGPMSPPFLNKPRSPRRNESSSSAQNADMNISPSKLMLPPQERKFFKRRLSSQNLTSGINEVSTEALQSPTKSIEEVAQSDSTQSQQNQSAFDVFEMRLEDTAVERHLSSFKTFRKRRLADKKYEFNDADHSAENIIPLKMTRRKSKYSLQGNAMNFANPRSPRNENVAAGNESPRGSYSEISHPKSPRAHYIMSPVMSPNYMNDSSVSDVLRPLNNNSKVKVSALSPNSNLNSFDVSEVTKVKEEDLDKDVSSHTLLQGPKKLDIVEIPTHPHAKPTISVHVNCVAKVLRSYIQKEDDNMSVITDIEDEYQGYPFPVALPLEVHGAGYQQLQMISNSKAEKFQVPVVQVVQRTLDIEMLCNEVANLICLASDKHYCSCIDFDLAFAEANPDRGTVTSIVVMLVQATSIKQRNRGEKINQLAYYNGRMKYEAFFSCEWIPNREHCRILYKTNLQELETVPDPWHPTENMESIIKCHLSTLLPTKKTLSNALAVHDWQSLDELVDASGIVTLFKDEGSTLKTERRLNDFNSVMFETNVDLASIPSTTTDSDDEWGM